MYRLVPDFCLVTVGKSVGLSNIMNWLHCQIVTTSLDV